MSKTPKSKKKSPSKSSTEDDRAVLIINTLNGCGACEQYKRTEHVKLLEQLEQQSIPVEPILLSYNSFDKSESDLPSGTNTQVVNFAEWYPSFVLFPRKLWNARSERLDGKVLGGTVHVHEGKTFVERTGPVFYEAAAVLHWIEKTLKEGLTVPHYHKDFAVLED